MHEVRATCINTTCTTLLSHIDDVDDDMMKLPSSKYATWQLDNRGLVLE
jgi:hypothetical protein